MEGERSSYHSLGENMVSEEFLKFMFGLEKEENIIINPENPHISIMIATRANNGWLVRLLTLC